MDLWRQGGRRVSSGWCTYDDITAELSALGIEVVSHTIDVAGFWRYVDQVGYRSSSYWDGGRALAGTEKWLEHYVSIELTKPARGEVFVDIASCDSPFPDILRERWGCRTYRQDLLYPRGIEGDRIGGNASSLPVADGFADGLTLHCSFEHFEGDHDFLFLREAGRVLRRGGRLCILPIYTNRRYCIQTDPAAWQTRLPTLERDATICIAEGWGEVHGRFYDPGHFVSRVLGNAKGMTLRIHRIENYLEVAPDCYLRFAAMFTKE
jgi:SAM-dependent methyltransferase